MNVVESIGIALELDTEKIEKQYPSILKRIISFFEKIDEEARKVTGVSNTWEGMIEQIKKARDKVNDLDNLFKDTRKSAGNFANFIRNAFGAIVVSAAGAWLTAFSSNFAKMKEEVKAIKELSEETGDSVETISAWSNAIEFDGGNAKAFQNTLTSIKKNIANLAEKEGSKAFAKSGKTSVLEMLGIDVAETDKMTAIEIIDEISTAIEKMDKAQSKNLLKQLGVDKDTIKFLQENNDNIGELIEQQIKWGVYTEKDAKALENMEKAIKQMSHVLKTTFIPLFSKIITTASKVVVYISKAAIWLRNNLDIVRKAVILLAIAFSTKLAKAIKTFGSQFVKSKFGMIILAITTLLLLIEDFYGYTQGKKSALPGLWEKLGDPKEAENKVKHFMETIEKLGDVFDSAIGKWLIVSGVVGKLLFSFNSLNLAIAGIPLAMGTAATVALALLIGFVYVYREELLGVFNFFKNAILDIPNIIKALINELSPVASEIADFLTNPIPKIKKAWEDFKEWFIKEFGSLDKIMNRMATEGHAARVAKEATGGGNSGNTEITDNRKVDVTINATTKEAGEGAVNRAISYSKLADSGVGP